MTNELTFRIIAVGLLVCMKLIRSRTQKISDSTGNREAYKRNRIDSLLLYSMGILWSASVVVYGLAPQWIEWASLNLPAWLRWTGVGFGIASLALLAWSDHHLGKNFSATLRVRDSHTLVESGPYRRIRHPIYTSGTLFAIAMWLVTSNWVVGLCWSGVFILYAQRIPREEAMMLEEFGESYRDYMSRTGRLMPKIR